MSVDETSIRSDASSGRQWTFAPPKNLKQKQVMERKSLNPLLASKARMNEALDTLDLFVDKRKAESYELE